GAGRTSDGNGSHASTLKSPSYTKSVSWQHYLKNEQAFSLFLDEERENSFCLYIFIITTIKGCTFSLAHGLTQ
ncbi:hypothetical protein, partial [Shigella sp. FC2710]|uniref:hypothetical protein n=1 Tax=Shigella sp. FC2710 TaxID=1898676 RepID=UPI001C0A69DF